MGIYSEHSGPCQGSRAARWDLAFLLLLLPVFAAAEPPEKSGGQSRAAALAALAQKQGFSLSGAERLGEVAAPVMEEGLEPEQRLRLLLGGFNHVLVRGSDGAIERLIITGRKRGAAEVPREIALPTRRRGPHHLVEVTALGRGNRQLDLTLMVDTGATYLVLPLSLAERLGLDPGALQPRQVQTANGPAPARVGRLPGLRLGNERLEDVQTAFVDDKRLGGTMLLGMSVLERYRVTLDDRNDRLLLLREPESPTGDE